MTIAPCIQLHDSATWPTRMTRIEVAYVCRFSVGELRRRVGQGRFPASDDGKTWHRDTVIAWQARVKEYERQRGRRHLKAVSR